MDQEEPRSVLTVSPNIFNHFFYEKKGEEGGGWGGGFSRDATYI